VAAGAKRGVEAFRVELEEHVAAHLIGPGASRLAEIERLAKKRFFLEGKTGVPLDHFNVAAEGKLADIAPKAPVAEGAEIRLELVEVGLHDVNAGMGKLDGLSVCVAAAGGSASPLQRRSRTVGPRRLPPWPRSTSPRRISARTAKPPQKASSP